MFLRVASLFLAASFGATHLTTASPIEERSGPKCTNVTFTATATAQNKAFPLNLSDPTELVRTIQDRVFTLAPAFTLTSKIVARYCEPEVYVPFAANTLQFMLHSITNNKNFWSGLGPPGQGYQGDSYSWIAFASKLGYPTLSLDRLGNGDSDHPDPLAVVQGPYEYQLYHAMINQIKSGSQSPLPRTYSDIVLIGNSYGSVIIDNMLNLFPKDVDKAIMTGYSKGGLESLTGIFDVAPGPASVAFPARFGNLPGGYLTTTSADGRRGAFYGGIPNVVYDTNIFTVDNNNRDTVTLGQFLSNYLDGATVAPNYQGRTLVLTGEEDYAFCGPGSPTLGPAKCGQLLPQTGALFPASQYNWYSVANTGHSNPFHYSRFETFTVAHAFIAGAHFAKTG